MSSAATNDNGNSKFLSTFTKNILNSHKSIRWVGIIEKNVIIINEQYREGLNPLLTNEENQEYTINTITRHKTRTKFEPKIGKLTYAFGRYENLSLLDLIVYFEYLYLFLV